MTLTAKQAAQELGLSARKLYELAAAGKLACYRFDGAVRFDRADLETYKTSCRLPAIIQANGSTNLTASYPVPGESALTAYFQKVGQKNKRTSTIGLNRRASTRLLLVSQNPSP